MSINAFWVLLAGFLVFFMQAGFALVETGFTRAKNVAHTMMMNMMVFCIGAVGYWLTGFAFQFGGVNYTYPAIHGLDAWAFSPVTLGDWTGLLDKPLLLGGAGVLGLKGFLLGGLGANFGVLAFFLFQMVFMDTAATIPTGSMAERFKFAGFALMGLWVSMFIYPLIGNWVWGGGWLADLGRTVGWGNGTVDFAGSGVVHMVGGAVGLAGALAIGPRIGRFNRDGSANAIPAHNIPMGVLGTIILFFGWFGFNPGSALGFVGGFRNLAVNAAVNTLMAGAAGGCAAMLYMWLFSPARKPDPGLSVNGILAGLVAITAPCAFVDSLGAVIIGLVAGVWVCLATFGLEKLKIDDPVGAVPVHLCNGLWGVLAVGLFANGNPDTAAWNGVASPVTGLFYGGATQILAQLAEGLTILVVVFGLSYAFFKLLAAFKLLRVSAADEMAGLDLPEMGVEGYPAELEPAPVTA
ncbi:MAG: ammonium transporter [Chloroflexi bacterium]|nr:ammonium transporter [Anaerolineaceae bacterium]NMB89398.1 ammonium transporter [Chloroflexota bacterium]